MKHYLPIENSKVKYHPSSSYHFQWNELYQNYQTLNVCRVLFEKNREKEKKNFEQYTLFCLTGLLMIEKNSIATLKVFSSPVEVWKVKESQLYKRTLFLFEIYRQKELGVSWKSFLWKGHGILRWVIFHSGEDYCWSVWVW